MSCVKDKETTIQEMKKKMKKDMKKKWIKMTSGCLSVLLLMGILAGCGSSNTDNREETAKTEEEQASGAVTDAEETKSTGLQFETAKDGRIDFNALQEENPEIWGWLYIPGTDIDQPLLQSATSDTWYQDHTADGQEGEEGALYIEIPNQINLCDFNTVIHGKDQKEDDLFYALHKFEDPDFFQEHEALYIYTPDNVYTYSIYAAYYDEGSDILRRYDYTTYQGCDAYLADYYDRRDMSMNKREGWEDLTAGHFLLTLDGSTVGDKQFVVMAGLVNAGVADMDRTIFDGTDFVYDFEDGE